jgi:hypothetical protein
VCSTCSLILVVLVELLLLAYFPRNGSFVSGVLPNPLDSAVVSAAIWTRAAVLGSFVLSLQENKMHNRTYFFIVFFAAAGAQVLRSPGGKCMRAVSTPSATWYAFHICTGVISTLGVQQYVSTRQLIV